jgi:hypothetical protein
MKKYNKPTIEIETIVSNSNIAALSNATNNANTFDENDSYTWGDFWN